MAQRYHESLEKEFCKLNTEIKEIIARAQKARSLASDGSPDPDREAATAPRPILKVCGFGPKLNPDQVN